MRFQVVEQAHTPVIPSFLSPRQREIADLRAQGLPDKVIAAKLGIKPSTVAVHVNSISAKLKSEGFIWANVIIQRPESTPGGRSK